MSARRRLLRVEVEIDLCELCRKPPHWHTSEGACDDNTGRRRPRPGRPRFYQGRRVASFIDLDSPQCAGGQPDWETIALFVENAAGQVGL